MGMGLCAVFEPWNPGTSNELQSWLKTNAHPMPTFTFAEDWTVGPLVPHFWTIHLPFPTVAFLFIGGSSPHAGKTMSIGITYGLKNRKIGLDTQ